MTVGFDGSLVNVRHRVPALATRPRRNLCRGTITEQRPEWRERAEVWADTAAAEFPRDLVALLPEGVSEDA